MIKSGQAIAGGFPVDSAPDGAITATLIVNGVDNAAELTVTNYGLNYKWAGTAPALSAGDIVQVRAAGAWDAVAASAIVWSDVADTALASDAYSRLGAPAGASVSADVAAVKSETAAVKAKTDNLPASPAAVGSAMTLAAGQDVRNVTGAVAGAVGSVTAGVTIAAGQTVETVTTLTNLPAAPADWLTAAAVKADAVAKIQNGLATPTNITAGTITTVTNLTNAPANGDLTAAMKTSVTTAASASTPVVTLAAAALTAVAGAVWGAGTRTLTSFGTLAADVWGYATRILTAGTNLNIPAAAPDATAIQNAAAAALAAYDPPTKAELDSAVGAIDMDAAGIRAAVGLEAADLDDQLAAIAEASGMTAADVREAMGMSAGTTIDAIRSDLDGVVAFVATATVSITLPADENAVNTTVGRKVLTQEAVEGSQLTINATFDFEPDGTETWTLVDESGVVVNSREDQSLATGKIYLSGADLPGSEFADSRMLCVIVDAVYAGSPFRDAVWFKVKNLIGV